MTVDNVLEYSLAILTAALVVTVSLTDLPLGVWLAIFGHIAI